MAITATEVKLLREKTGAGMMDCKKALQESGGDMDKAIDYLRKKGLQKVEKKAGRSTQEGIIQSYIHPGSKLGVLVQLNCETDFVAKTEDFHQLAKDLAMQIAAASPLVISREELPQEQVDKELEIYKEQARNEGKPDNIVDKIALGKIEKYYQEVCLMEQIFIKDSKKTVNDVVLEIISKLGENIKVGRFVRFRLGD